MINLDKFQDFMDGDRLVMLTLRSKDGGTNNPDRAAKKKISHSKEDFIRIVNEFDSIRKTDERIYSSVNKRSINKAIREFKLRQLEADYYDVESRNNFYFDLHNRWVSCFMSPHCRSETIFLIDIDDIIKKGTNWNISIIDNYIKEKGIEEILRYNTKNGVHILTKPFNPSIWNSEFGEIKKDALLLISF